MSGPDDFELPRLLGDLERRLSKRLVRLLGAAGSSVSEWRVLARVVEAPGLTMSDVASSLAIPASSATKLIDVMVARNLVYRRSDEGDRRKVVIHLGARGRSLYERLAPLVEAERAALAELADEGDLQQLTRILTQLTQQVS